jgi:hypothetical protein
MRTWGSTTVAFLVNQVKSLSASSTRSAANLSRKKAWASPVGRALSASQRATALSAWAWAGACVFEGFQVELVAAQQAGIGDAGRAGVDGRGERGHAGYAELASSCAARARAWALVAYT